MARVVAFGEALWDLLPAGAVLGGAPLNFAYRIGTLGHRATMVSALGADDLGDRALARMAALGMDTAYVQRSPRWPTGTVNVFLDASGSPDFTINSPAAYDHIELRADLERLVGDADCLCFGTVAQRTRGSRATLAALLGLFRGRLALYDVNLRKGSYSREVIEESLRRAQVAKLNEDELIELTGMLGLDGESIPARADSLIAAARLDYCLVTLGRRGAYAAARSGQKTYSPAFRVASVDATGAGDAFGAGFVHGILEGEDLKKACRRGNAFGSLVTTQSGATQPLPPGALDELLAAGEHEPVEPELAEYL